MTAAAATPAPSMFHVFRKREFALMWTAQFVSTIGSSLTALAAGILVFERTQSALSVGLTLMVTAIPTLLVGLIAGVFVDRYDRKRILLASDFLRAVIVLSIPFGVPAFGLIGLYIPLLLSATVQQFFDPAWESILPEIASDEELAAANSFLSISAFGSTAVGFAMAGFLAGIDIHLPFFIDAATFLFSFACVLFVRVPRAAAAEESTTVGVVVENLRSGVRYLWGTPILRSAILVSVPVLFSFGLWNVLLLPMAIKVLHATEFEYGLQEGLTSVGFVVSSFAMAKYADRLREGQWVVIATAGMAVFGFGYSMAPNIWVAIAMVVGSGFFNSPMGVARRLIFQRNTPREMRGRVSSAFAVTRDVVFLLGMAAAGIGDLVDIRLLIAVSAAILVVAAVLTQLAPGLGTPAAEWRRAAALLRNAATAPVLSAGRPATPVDFGVLAGLVPELGAMSRQHQDVFMKDAVVKEAATGTAIVKVGDASDSAFFVLKGRAVAGVPTDSGQERILSTMGPGDFFGEIAALTGNPRTANIVVDEPIEVVEVPAATLKHLMDEPGVQALVTEKMRERLTNTAQADLIRLAGLDQRDLRDLRRRRRGHHHRPASGDAPHADTPDGGAAGDGTPEPATSGASRG